MLKILKKQSGGYCDGLNRRDFLQIGGGGFGLVDAMTRVKRYQVGQKGCSDIGALLPACLVSSVAIHPHLP